MNKSFPSVWQIYDKCDTKDVLSNIRDETCVTMLKTLEMSVMGTYKVRTTHFLKDDLL